MPLKNARIGFAALAAVSLVTVAAAAMIIVYTNNSTADLSLKEPPIQWAAGPDASGNAYTADWTLSSNATYFSVTLKPVAEANVTWGNLTNLRNADTTSVSNVVVRGTSLADHTAHVQVARAEFYDYAAPTVVAGTLDLTTATPSLALGTLDAGERYFVKVYIQTASGTGQQDLPSSITFSVDVTP